MTNTTDNIEAVTVTLLVQPEVFTFTRKGEEREAVRVIAQSESGTIFERVAFGSLAQKLKAAQFDEKWRVIVQTKTEHLTVNGRSEAVERASIIAAQKLA